VATAIISRNDPTIFVPAGIIFVRDQRIFVPYAIIFGRDQTIYVPHAILFVCNQTILVPHASIFGRDGRIFVPGPRNFKALAEKVVTSPAACSHAHTPLIKKVKACELERKIQSHGHLGLAMP